MKKVRVRVPGKVLLAGEYAVLRGHATLSLALERYLDISLETRLTKGWRVQSDLWQEAQELSELDQDTIASEALLRVCAFAEQHFGLAAIECRVQSDLNIRHGLGSSSALYLGVLMAAQCLAAESETWDEKRSLEIARISWQMQREQQGFASGYDVLTKALGGLPQWTPDFENWPGTAIKRLPQQRLTPWLTIMVGGQGAPTAAVGRSVRQALREQNLAAALAEASDKLLEGWLALVEHGGDELPRLLQANREHRQILAQLPFFPKTLFQQLADLPGFDQTWSLKTTGAGGEDALLLIGANIPTAEARLLLSTQGWHALGCKWSTQGAEIYRGDSR